MTPESDAVTLANKQCAEMDGIINCRDLRHKVSPGRAIALPVRGLTDREASF